MTSVKDLKTKRGNYTAEFLIFMPVCLLLLFSILELNRVQEGRVMNVIRGQNLLRTKGGEVAGRDSGVKSQTYDSSQGTGEASGSLGERERRLMNIAGRQEQLERWSPDPQADLLEKELLGEAQASKDDLFLSLRGAEKRRQDISRAQDVLNRQTSGETFGRGFAALHAAQQSLLGAGTAIDFLDGSHGGLSTKLSLLMPLPDSRSRGAVMTRFDAESSPWKSAHELLMKMLNERTEPGAASLIGNEALRPHLQVRFADHDSGYHSPHYQHAGLLGWSWFSTLKSGVQDRWIGQGDYFSLPAKIMDPSGSRTERFTGNCMYDYNANDRCEYIGEYGVMVVSLKAVSATLWFIATVSSLGSAEVSRAAATETAQQLAEEMVDRVVEKIEDEARDRVSDLVREGVEEVKRNAKAEVEKVLNGIQEKVASEIGGPECLIDEGSCP